MCARVDVEALPNKQALQSLKEAKSGLYCGPLRLLAWEVHERLNEDGALLGGFS
mgnify:CR=1 FL=1